MEIVYYRPTRDEHRNLNALVLEPGETGAYELYDFGSIEAMRTYMEDHFRAKGQEATLASPAQWQRELEARQS